MTKNTNPFAAFDMTKFADEFTKMAGGMDVKAFDVDAIMKSQQKNMDALSAANTAVIEGVQAIAQRQSEIFQATVAETQTAITNMGKAKDPQEAAAKQVELIKGAFEGALTNMRELADIAAKSNEASAEKINARFTESLDEIKAQTLKK